MAYETLDKLNSIMVISMNKRRYEMKKIRKKIGIIVSILLLIIGGVYAENSTEDSSNVSIEDTPNISIGDINGSSAKEDIALEEGGVYKNITGTPSEERVTEKKPAPGFGYIITVIMFLSALIVIIRRR